MILMQQVYQSGTVSCGTTSAVTTSADGGGGNTKFINYMTNGLTTGCPGAVARQSRITVTCGAGAFALTGVSEGPTCTYVFTATAPQVCAGYVPPSKTATVTPTRTPSNSPTGTVTPTRTRSASWTPTLSRTASWTPTLSRTGSWTPTAAVTPTRTRTASPTVTQSRSITPTITGSRTVSATATASLTPSVTPAQLVIIGVTVMTVVRSGVTVGVVGLTGRGYRTGDNALTATPVISNLRSLTAVNTTYITVEMDALDAYWSTATLILTNVGYNTSAVKPPLAPPGGVVYTPSLLTYGARLRINATGIGAAGPTEVHLRAATGGGGSTDAPCTALQPLPPNALECTPLLVPDALFGTALVAHVTFKPGTQPVQLIGATVMINRPTVVLPPLFGVGAPPVTAPGPAAVLLSQVPPPAAAWRAAALPLPPTWNSTRVVMYGYGSRGAVVGGSQLTPWVPAAAVCAAAPLARSAPAAVGLAPRVRLSRAMSVATASAGLPLAYAPPWVAALSPSAIAITPSSAPLGAPRNLSFLVTGGRFGSAAAPVLRSIEVGGVACGGVAVLNATLARCTNWTAPSHATLTSSSNDTAVRFAVVLVWGPRPPSTATTTRMPAVILLRAALRPAVWQVTPALIQTGSRITVLGVGFLPAATTGAAAAVVCTPGDCAAAAVTVTVGGAPCTAPTVLSDTAVTCTAPAGPVLAPGYPTVAVVVSGPSGATSPPAATAYVSYTVAFTVAMNTTANTTSAAPRIPVLPAGRAPASQLPWAPAPVVVVSGLGTGVCWLELENVTLPATPPDGATGVPLGLDLQTDGTLPVALVGNVIQPVALPAGTPLVPLAFSDVGLSSPAGAIAVLSAQCLDSNAAVSRPPTRLTLAAATFRVAWQPASRAAVDGDAVALPPSTLLPLVVEASWDNLTTPVPAEYASMFSCMAVLLVPGAAPPPSSTPLTQYNASLVMSGGVATSPTAAAAAAAGAVACDGGSNTTSSCWGISLSGASLAASAAPGGANVSLAAECTWEPTGERARLPTLALRVAGASVSWSAVDAANQAPRGELPLFLGEVSGWPAVVSHTATAGTEPAAATCTLRTLPSDVDGGAYLGDGASRVAIPTTSGDGGALDSAVMLAVQGNAGGSTVVQLVCVLWDGLEVGSAPVRLRIRSLSLRPTSQLPTTFVASDGAVPTVVFPPPSFVVVAAPDDSVVYDVSCIATTTTPGGEVRMSPANAGGVVLAAAAISPDAANGTITLAGLVLVVPFETQYTALTVTCSRPVDDAPVPFTWQLAQSALRMAVCEPPALLTDGIGRLPPWAVAVVLVNASAPEGVATAVLADACNASLVDGGVAGDAAAAAAALLSRCTATIPAPPAGDTAQVGFVNGQAAALVNGVSGPPTFGAMSLVGTRGASYNLTAQCMLGSTALPGSATWSVQLLPCPVGYAPAGIDCSMCGAGTFTLGRNEAVCIGCPHAGAKCDRGILTLLPAFYRPPSENGADIGPHSSLLECYNAEACTMNTSTVVYGCTTGYAGALCGTCEEGYGMFGAYCRKCWPVEATRALLALILLLFIGGLTVVARRRGSSGSDNPAPIALKLLLGYVQAVSSLRVFKAAGTRAFRDAMEWTDSVSESPLSAGALQCQLQWPFLVRYAVTVALPALAAATAIALYSVIAAKRATSLPCRRSGPAVGCFNTVAWRADVREWLAQRRPVSIMVFVLFVAYMPIVSASFRVLQCMTDAIDGVYWLVSDLSVQCYAGQHAVATTLAVVVLAVFGAGFPLGIYRIMAHATARHLREPHFSNAFSFLYAGYKQGDLGDAESPAAEVAASDAAGPDKDATTAVGGDESAILSQSNPLFRHANAAGEAPRSTAVAAAPPVTAGPDKAPRAANTKARCCRMTRKAAPLRGLHRRRTICEWLTWWAPRHTSFVWWESVVISRKAIVVLLSAAVPNPFNQVVGAVLLFSASVALQLHFQPFSRKLFNYLELALLVSLYLTAAISTILLPSAMGTATVSEGTTNAVTVVLILLNVATVIALGVVAVRVGVGRGIEVLRDLLRRCRGRPAVAAGVSDAGSGTVPPASVAVAVPTSAASKRVLVLAASEESPVAASAAAKTLPPTPVGASWRAVQRSGSPPDAPTSGL